MDEKVKKAIPNPYEKANIFSKFTFSYISPLLTLGKKRPLKEEDLYSPIKSDESECLTEKMQL